MEIVYYAAASLDGYIATADGGVEWLDAFDGEEGDYGFADFYASLDALLMGSKTYEFALAQPEWMSPDRPSWVFTRRDLRQAHPSVTLTADDPADVVAEMEADGHRRAWLVGGGELAASFERRGLITEYVISLIPTLLGDGIPLFGRPRDEAGAPAPPTSPFPHHLTRVASRAYPSGLVQVTYRHGLADAGT